MVATTKKVESVAMTELSAHAREEIDELLSHFPADQKKSALLGALNVVQHENKGFLTEELMSAVADYLDLAKIEVYEVASFYSMYELKPVARNMLRYVPIFAAC